MAPPLTSQPGVLGATARFWQRSYAPDYLGIVLLEVAYELVGCSFLKDYSYSNAYQCTDHHLRQPFPSNVHSR
jgi:hypothetical protein